jgi:hypothetical protein
MSRSHRIATVIKLFGAFAAPFVVAVATYELAKLAPGTVSITHWKALVSMSFVAAGLVSLYLLWRTKLTGAAKAILGIFVSAVFLLCAFTFALRSNCGGESAFIGSPRNTILAASCS